MRTLTSGQLAVLDGVLYTVGVRVLIADGDGIMRDYASQAGYNWIDSVEIDVNINQPVSQATINLRRDIIDGSGTVLSLSPLRTDSSLNRNTASAYAPAIDIGRAIRVLVATTTYGTAFISTDWQNLFEGKIDSLDIGASSIPLTCRDLGGALVDQFILADDNDIAPNYGSDAGTPVETVMQQILDGGMGAGVVTLYCPTSPGYDITPYSQQIQSVMDALQALADLIGWDIRYCWDDGTSAWRLTLQAIDRTKTTPDRTIAPSRYLQVSQLQWANTDIRNVITVWYLDATTGAKAFVTVKNDDSIAQLGGPGVGERPMVVDESSGVSPINTAAQATAFANNMLVDLSPPMADQIIVEHLDWSFELNDLQLYTANDIHYDTDQKWAVISYKHSISATQARTTVEVKGAPCGPYLSWLARASIPVNVAITPTLDNLRIVSEDDASFTYGWVNGASTSEVWAAYKIFAAPVPEEPWEIVAAEVLPLSTDTFVIPKPPAGSLTYAQIEPRSAALVAGDVWQVVIPPGQPPLVFGASPQGTISVDTNGNWSASIDGPQQALSYRWMTSTSGFPDDATVQSSGTIVNGRIFSIVDGGTLDFGETIYLTAVPYDGVNATGGAGQSLHVRGSYQTYSATKTAHFSAGSYRPTNTAYGFLEVDGIGIGPDNNYFIWEMSSVVTIPAGCTILSVDHLLKYSDGPPLDSRFVRFFFYRITGTTRTQIATGTATVALGWQTLHAVLSELTTGNTYLMLASIVSTDSLTPGSEAAGPFDITYSIPDPTVAI